MIHGHGGNVYALARQLGCGPGKIVDLSSNINPLGPMPELMAHLDKFLPSIAALPEVDSRTLAVCAAVRFGADAEGIAAGNGTTQFIHALPRILGVRKALIVGPTYADYADACTRSGARVHHLLGRPEKGFAPNLLRLFSIAHKFDTVFICNPNNPTGTLIRKKDLEPVLSAFPKTRFVIDESYLPFVEEGEKESLAASALPNRLVLFSFSKIFAVPGLRAGMMFFDPRLKKSVFRELLPWSVNTLAQSSVLYVLENPAPVQRYIRKTQRFLEAEKRWFLNRFQGANGIRFFASRTGFVVGRLHRRHGAGRLWTHLARQRILIRNCSNFKGLSDHYVRLSIKTRPFNRLCSQHMLDYLSKKDS